MRPLVNEPPPPNRDYNRDPDLKTLDRRGFINRGSTLEVSLTEPDWALWVRMAGDAKPP